MGERESDLGRGKARRRRERKRGRGLGTRERGAGSTDCIKPLEKQCITCVRLETVWIQLNGPREEFLRVFLVRFDVALEAAKRAKNFWVIWCCLDRLVVAFFRLLVPFSNQIIIKRPILVDVKPPLGVQPREALESRQVGRIRLDSLPHAQIIHSAPECFCMARWSESIRG